ncbi:delta and Notch-like EGF repeat containing weary [Musca autumnalis]|uniref:delta and Notch-like EGF repeat containing weary n=1 Tax=Musca autumnalis TaxID=221902 RepID=UPI003CEC2A20
MKGYIKMSNNWIALMVFALMTSQITLALNTMAAATTATNQILLENAGTTTTGVIASSTSSNDKAVVNDLHFTPGAAAEVVTINTDTPASQGTVATETKRDSLSHRTTTESLMASTPLQNALAETNTPTLASSNAPATTILSDSEKLTTATADKSESHEKETKKESSATAVVPDDNDEKGQQQIMPTMTMTEQQTTISKQQQQKQQTLTTEVSMLKETDVQQQVNGNAQTMTVNPPNNVITLKATATDNDRMEKVEREEKGMVETEENMEKILTTKNIPLTTIGAVARETKEKRDIVTEPEQFKMDDPTSVTLPGTVAPQEEISNGKETSSSFYNSPSTTQTQTEDNVENLHFDATSSRNIATSPQTSNAEQQQQISVDDFKPLIQEANNKLLAERTIFTPKNLIEQQEWKQNLMPNEVEDYEHPDKHGESKKVYAPTSPYEHNINWSPYLHPATPVAVDFTGKVLQEEDGVITEIEEKFRLKEFATDINDKKDNEEVTSTTMEAPLPQQHTLAAKEAGPEIVENSTPKPYLSLMVNHEKSPPNTHRSQVTNHPHNVVVMRPVEFIERRVKKSFDFPMHRIASDANHAMQHFDFANTKFTGNLNEPRQHLNPPLTGVQDTPSAAAASGSGALNQGHDMNVMHVPRLQPEFSTTKFYNSKELYNEMLQHKNKQQPPQPHMDKDSMNMLKEEEDITPAVAPAPGTPSLTLNSFAVLHSPKIAKLEEIHEQQPQKSLAIKRVTVQQSPSTKAHNKSDISTQAPTSATPSTTTTSTTTRINIAATTISTAQVNGGDLLSASTTKKFHKELKKAKLLIKTITPNNNNNSNNNENTQKTQTTNSSTTTPSGHNEGYANTATATAASAAHLTTNPTTLTSSKPQDISRSNTLTSSSASASSPLSSSTTQQTASNAPFVIPSYVYPPPTWRPTASHSTNPTKSAMKPIVRPRILSRLQEKINSLECEIPNVPQDSHLWRGNETHELLLPIMTPENCKTDKDCTAMMVSWEGEAEIQSGDILIVEINDALLNPKEVNLTTSAHNTQVYQVTRSGHEHCDVTEGILLDITPLIVDGRKLVTLYDKDLTEGVNLLIVVSELWGSQCVRLKVTTKTENCGESADCSGKGVCYSNTDMEEYECQCCSGFAGPHCEEIDACTPSPCTNNGICVDLSQGHEGNSYQCLCPYGYTGKNCQYELDPCNPAECMNGGSCVGNSTHFRCECAPGFTGPLCQHILNECESSPCIHGICVDQEDGFRCFCQPGFAGELCNFEYNECESNPCQNGGECIDHIGSYECRCTKGYTGTRCHIKVDFCANNPCPEGRRCIDHGNDYSCECLGGRNGPDCNEMLRTQCNVNPCTHGGTCWSSGDSFYCACRPGYTGTLCEDEFVVETVVSSSEFMVDDTSARNFNDKSFGSSVVLKSPIELHNAYTAAIVLALVIFFVALYLTICHCKVNQTYRKFSTRTYGFLPILGFRWRTKQATSKISRHWLSGKGLGGGGATGANAMRVATNSTLSAPLQRNSVGHLPTANASAAAATSSTTGQRHHHVGQLNERPFQRHLAMNLENDMYYTVDFSENSQHSPLIQ